MKLHLTAISALIGLGLLASQASFGKDLSCADWSFDNPHCPAYITPAHATSAQPANAPQPAQCNDWSFNDPHCAAFISPPNRLAAANPVAAGNPAGAMCADWSFNDPSCPAYIRH